MTKQQSLIIKGVAIMMMLYVHLFSSTENVQLCEFFLYYGHTPLVQKLTRIAPPVPFFLIVSGYGFYKMLHRQSTKTDWHRSLSLFKSYWLVNIVLALCACVFVPGALDVSLRNVVLNVTGLDTSYNPHCWFLLPYVLLLFSKNFICRFVEQQKAGVLLLAGLAVHLGSFALVGKFTEHLLFNLAINYFYLWFPFILGAMLAKYDWHDVKWLRALPVNFDNSVTSLMLLLALMALKINFPGITNPAYAILFVFLFNKIKLPARVQQVLGSLGKYSAEMWFVHGWLISVFLYDFLFGLRIPLVIWLVLVTATWCLSFCFRKLVERV